MKLYTRVNTEGKYLHFNALKVYFLGLDTQLQKQIIKLNTFLITNKNM